MKRQMRLIIVMPLVLLLAVACADKDLETVAKSMMTVSQALGTLQQGIIGANAVTPKLISDDATNTILVTCVKINQAGLETDKVIRQLNALAPADRTKLTQVLDPIITTVGTALTGVTSLGITDEKTRNAVTASLLLIQTSLNAAKLASALK